MSLSEKPGKTEILSTSLKLVLKIGQVYSDLGSAKSTFAQAYNHRKKMQRV